LPELLQRQYGPNMKLSAEHLVTADPVQMLQRLSRNLRQLHLPTTITSAP
jgi:regulator of sirC expression with transglutaminase-like and TPR domain